MSGGVVFDRVEIALRDRSGNTKNIYFDVYDTALARKWHKALENLLVKDYHLEKNYCFLGFTQHDRSGPYILDQINRSIQAINHARLGYVINDSFDIDNTVQSGTVGDYQPGLKIKSEKFNLLHRYFEDLQGVSGKMSEYFQRADATTRWHIRQLNLLCHEFESWMLSFRKAQYAPEWQRPSQLMCWLNAPRFVLDVHDFELFGVETLNRTMGGVYLGVNKAVGKHHWEVFNDEGRDSRVGELVTSTLKSQTEAAGDFDIEWAVDPGKFEWQKKYIQEFCTWLRANGFDPEDKTLTIGHPKIGQIDLQQSFGSETPNDIWNQLNTFSDVYKVSTSRCSNDFQYRWDDADFMQRQVSIIEKGMTR